SLIADSTARTSSLLGTEDHRSPQRNDAQENEERDNDCVQADTAYDGRAPRGLDPEVSAGLDQRGGDTNDRDGPKRQPRQDARKMPTAAPTTLNARLKTGGSTGLPRRSLSHASAADTNANTPNTSSPQAPTDIGDQYLKLSPVSPGVTSTSMCQKRVQLTPRSAVRRMGQMMVAGRLT